MKARSLIAVLLLANCAWTTPQEALFSACLARDLAGVTQAVADGADVNAANAQSGQSPLAYSYFSPEVTAYLLAQGADPDGGSYPALVSAASVASLDVMRQLLAGGADPNSTGGGEAPLLKVVQMTNCVECARLLFDGGASPATTAGGYTNLIGVYASYGLPQAERQQAMATYGNLLKGYGVAVPDWYFDPSEEMNRPPADLLALLLEKGLDIDARKPNPFDKKGPGEPPLFTAMNVGKQDVIMSLLEAGADCNATSHVINPALPLFGVEEDYTVLLNAVAKGNREVVAWLLAKGDLKNTALGGKLITEKKMILSLSGISALYLAIINNDMELVRMLAESSLEWGELAIKALPGQKFESDYGAKPPVYQFAYKKKGKLTYTPSLFAEFSGLSEMSAYLKSKGL